jgi:hypothetical protein
MGRIMHIFDGGWKKEDPHPPVFPQGCESIEVMRWPLHKDVIPWQLRWGGAAVSDNGLRICDLRAGADGGKSILNGGETRFEGCSIRVKVADDLPGVIRSAKEGKSAGGNVSI